jgi:hypothetical protein
MRTNPAFTENEKNAYNAFCQQHGILNDQSSEGLQNAEHIGGYISQTWGEDVDARTLQVALEQLGDRLAFVPAEQAEVAEVLSKLDQSQRDIVASWLSHQHRLETDGPKGFSNVSVLVAWLLNRRYAVSEAGLNMALGNVQNTGKRKIYWKEIQKESREYVQGRPNHAFGQEPNPKAAPVGVQQQYINGRKNHAYTPPEEVAKKVAVQTPDAWQEICQLHLKEWVTPGQRAKLEGEYNAGIASGKSWRDIGAALGQIVKGWERGR